MRKDSKRFLLLASAFGCTGIALGAFAAHGLQNVLSHEMADVFKTGVRYQMYHTFALIAATLLNEKYSSYTLNVGNWFFVTGIILFSGSLYVLAVTGVPQFGFITPLGGLCFLGGWVLFGVGVFKMKGEN